MSSVPHVFLEQNHLSVFQQSPRYFSLTSDWACLHQCLSTGWYFTSILQLSPTQYLGPRWVCPGGLWAGPPTFLQMRGGQVPVYSTKKKIRISTNMGDPRIRTDFSNPFQTPKEMDGHKGPLPVPWLWFLIEFRWRREIYSGSLHVGCQNCQLKKYKLKVKS